MREAAMKIWQCTIATILLAPLAGCVSKSQLRQANEALELENFHLEQRLNETCWKLEDAERDLEISRTAVPAAGGPVSPMAPSSSPRARDPRAPAGAADIDQPPKVDLPDEEADMPGASMPKERAPRYDGPPIISPPDPKVPEGILPRSVSAHGSEEHPDQEYDREAPMTSPRDDRDFDAPAPEREPAEDIRPAQSPKWVPPRGSESAPAASQPLGDARTYDPMGGPEPTPAPEREPEFVSTPRPTAAAPYREPEAVQAPHPDRTPEPVARNAPAAEPEPVSAPLADFDREQPEGRSLVEPEPVGAPLPSALARSTSAPQPPAGGAASANSAPGNASLNLMAVNPKLTVWRQSANGSSPDDGLTVVVEPRNAAGELVEISGEVSIVVLDPAREGSAAKIARWDYPEERLPEHFRGTEPGGGLQFDLEWPTARPTANRLELYVRLTLSDRRQFMAEYTLEPQSGVVPSKPLSTPPAGPPATEPPGPVPAASPMTDGVSRTAAWSNVDESSSSVRFTNRDTVRRASPGASEWRRATGPAPKSNATELKSQSAASPWAQEKDSTPSEPAKAGTSWNPYR